MIMVVVMMTAMNHFILSSRISNLLLPLCRRSVVIPDGREGDAKLVVLRSDMDINPHLTKNHLGVGDLQVASARRAYTLLMQSFAAQEQVKVPMDQLDRVKVDADGDVAEEELDYGGHEVLVDDSIMPRGTDVDLVGFGFVSKVSWALGFDFA